jgi:hypothetical protein
MDSPLTHEHIFPASLDREFGKDAARMAEPYWIDRLEKKMVGGEPTIKDVCRTCNNVVLSQLDEYGLQLYRRYFYRIAEQSDSVLFEFDYDRLLRWLLKMTYNSARANQASDLEALGRLRAYIIGNKVRPRRIALFLTLLYRHRIPDKVMLEASQKQIDVSPTHDPDMLRIGHFVVNQAGWNPLLSRTIILQSYFFSLIVIQEKGPAAELQRLKSLFLRSWPKAVLLEPTRNRIRIQASVPSEEAFNTHVWVNMDYYSRAFPQIFGASESPS